MQSVFARKIYTGKEIREKSYLLFEDNLLIGFSKSEDGDLLGRYDVITPAFIDSHSHIGMIRAGEPASESEANEKIESIFSHADALDSVQMDDPSFRESVESGVLYSCVLPGSGNIIGGKTAVIRNYGKNTSEALITRAGIKAAFGYNPMSTRDWKGTRPFTRMGALALLRQKLTDVKQKMVKKKTLSGDKKKEITFSAEEEVFKSLLSRKDKLRVHVHKTDDIASLLRIISEFDLLVTVEHTCDVHEEAIYKELKKRKIPVVFGPLDAFAYKVELKHENWRNIRYLLSSGVEFGLMTDHPVILQKMLLFELRWFIRCGLSKQEAIEIITLKNAGILGIDRYLGSLEKGKWSSFVGWNGDPFDMTKHPVAVYGEGSLLYSE
jgi:imidazolonepropionase-like amidohydrolase